MSVVCSVGLNTYLNCFNLAPFVRTAIIDRWYSSGCCRFRMDGLFRRRHLHLFILTGGVDVETKGREELLTGNRRRDVTRMLRGVSAA